VRPASHQACARGFIERYERIRGLLPCRRVFGHDVFRDDDRHARQPGSLNLPCELVIVDLTWRVVDVE
jgi:hypothetical protein